MIFAHLQKWWRRLLHKIGWGRKGIPVWGEDPPTILGVCSSCGAIVIEGFHREGPQGLKCLRCASADGKL